MAWSCCSVATSRSSREDSASREAATTRSCLSASSSGVSLRASPRASGVAFKLSWRKRRTCIVAKWPILCKCRATSCLEGHALTMPEQAVMAMALYAVHAGCCGEVHECLTMVLLCRQCDARKLMSNNAKSVEDPRSGVVMQCKTASCLEHMRQDHSVMATMADVADQAYLCSGEQQRFLLFGTSKGSLESITSCCCCFAMQVKLGQPPAAC